MKHIVVDLEMNSVEKKYKNLDCIMETIEIMLPQSHRI